MAFQKKYYYYFKGLTDVQYTVEIWQDIDTDLVAEEIRADDTPFVVTYPSTDNKFETIRGSGCDLNILSDTSLKFLDLYTSNMMEYQIKLITGGASIWKGYLDSELYSEPFAEYDNYPVSLTGNDGLALLDRIDFYESNGTKYTGFTDNWTIITNILQKLELTWTKIYVALTTTSPELSISGSRTLLTETYSNCDNFYDEDDKAMTCREVLETILKPFGAYIQIINNNVYITDVNYLASAGSSGFAVQYDSFFAYEGVASITNGLGDVSDIKFATNSQTLNIISPINKQIVKFSPYSNSTILDYDPVDDTFSGITVTRYKGTYPNTYFEKRYGDSTYWYGPHFTTLLSFFGELTGTNSNDEKTDKYLSYISGFGYSDNVFTYTGVIPKIIVTPNYISTIYNDRDEWLDDTYYWINDVVTYDTLYYKVIQNHLSSVDDPPDETPAYYTGTTADILIPNEVGDLYYLQVDAKCYVRTTDNMGTQTDIGVYTLLLYTHLTIGDKKFNYYEGITSNWISTGSTGYFILSFSDVSVSQVDGSGTYTYIRNPIRDKWVELNNGESYINHISEIKPVIIPLYGFTGNDITFSMGGWYAWGSGGEDDPNNTTINSQIKDVRLKDIKFTILDKNKNEVKSEDIEYQSYININNKEDGEDIELKYGTNTEYKPVCKGGIITTSGTTYGYVQEFTRSGVTDLVENLLLRSVTSNYSDKTVEITCTINKPSTIFGYFTYDNYFPDKKFGIQGAVIDYSEDTTELTLQEIRTDSLDIVKNYI